MWEATGASIMWEAAISLFSDLNTVGSFAKNVGGLFKKDKNSQHFEQVVSHLGGIKAGLERLSDSILYAPNLHVVQDVQQTQQRRVDDLRTVRERLDPVQRALGSEILSSAIILTPEIMQQALAKNPWEVLHEIRPVDFFEAHKLPPEGVPVLFEHQGVRYMGWQMRGTLPILFNCRYEELWLPEAARRTPEIITSAAKSTPHADFVVSPSGEYSTITAALKQAKAGDQIVVKTGLYRENVILDKTVELIADGSPVIESTGRCIWMQTDYAVVRGFTLRCRARSSASFFSRLIGSYDKAVAVYIPQGKLVLEQCDVTSDSLSCVNICGRGTQAIVRACQLHDSQQAGIFIYDQATAQVEDCDIFGNANAGVSITTGGNPTVRRCKIHDGKAGGVFVCENGSGQLEDCDIFGNACGGVTITTGGNPTVRRCKIRDGSTGVLVSQNGSGQLEDCDIFGNAYSGIEIRWGGNPTVRRCTIKNNNNKAHRSSIELLLHRYAVVWIHDSGRGTIEECDLRDNPYSIWDIDSSSQVQRRGNKENVVDILMDSLNKLNSFADGFFRVVK